MDGRTANTPTHVSASDVPGVSLMPEKLVLMLWSDVAQCGALEEKTKFHSGLSYATESNLV